MKLPSSLRSIIAHLTLAAWNHRRPIFFLLSAASLIGNLVVLLSASFAWELDAVGACRFLYDHILLQFLKLLYLVLRPPYLYLVLNLILMTVVWTSGILAPAKHTDSLQTVDAHPVRPSKGSVYQLVIEKSRISRPMKQEETVGRKRQSLFTIEPVEQESPVTSTRSEPHRREEQIRGTNASVDVPFFTSVGDHQAQKQKGAGPCNLDHVLLEDPLHDQVKAQVLTIEKSRRPDEQLVPIGHMDDSGNDDMSREELNSRVEAYISKVRRNLSIQREDSLNRLYGLISRDTSSGRERLSYFDNHTTQVLVA